MPPSCFMNVKEVWKVSTTAGLKRGKKSLYGSETVVSNSQLSKEPEASGKSAASKLSSFTSGTESQVDSTQVSFSALVYSYSSMRLCQLKENGHQEPSFKENLQQLLCFLAIIIYIGNVSFLFNTLYTKLILNSDNESL